MARYRHGRARPRKAWLAREYYLVLGVSRDETAKGIHERRAGRRAGQTAGKGKSPFRILHLLRSRGYRRRRQWSDQHRRASQSGEQPVRRLLVGPGLMAVLS